MGSEKGRGFDLVAIAAEDGSILGVAYTGSARPDVLAVVRGVRNLYSGWNGLTHVSTAPLTAFGIDLSTRTSCRLGEKELQNSGAVPHG